MYFCDSNTGPLFLSSADSLFSLLIRQIAQEFRMIFHDGRVDGSKSRLALRPSWRPKEAREKQKPLLFTLVPCFSYFSWYRSSKVASIFGQLAKESSERLIVRGAGNGQLHLARVRATHRCHQNVNKIAKKSPRASTRSLDFVLKIGGPCGGRTHDNRIKSPVLCQLS